VEKKDFIKEFNINEKNFISKSLTSYYGSSGTKVEDMINIVDGPGDGGIDYFLDFDDKPIIIGQSKFSVFQKKEDLFNETNKLINNFQSISTTGGTKAEKSIKSDVSSKIKQIVENESDVVFQILFIGFSNNDLNKYDPHKLAIDFLNHNSIDDKHRKIEFIFGDFLVRGLRVYNPNFQKQEVNISFSLSYDGHCVPYSNNNSEISGFLINVSAYDMFSLIDKHGQLVFEQNVRHFLNNAGKSRKVNKNIIDSLENNTSLFWFANNGIIILCEDAKFNSNGVKLSKMSIINGAQTVSNIFHFLKDEADDNKFMINKNRLMSVFLPCKIVVLKKQDHRVINYIVQSSNTQKNVKQWTLFSNHKDVVKLNNRMTMLGYFLNYKDGILEDNIDVKSLSKSDKYKIIDLDQFVQAKVSIFDLKPGFASQSRDKLFSDDTYVIKLNEKMDDINFVMSIVKFYSQIRNNVGKINKFWIYSFLSLLLAGDRENFDWIENLDIDTVRTNIKNNVNLYKDSSFVLKYKKFIGNAITDEEIKSMIQDEQFIKLQNKFIEYCDQFKTGDYYSNNRFYSFIFDNINDFIYFVNKL
jgi:hypothetical protein